MFCPISCKNHSDIPFEREGPSVSKVAAFAIGIILVLVSLIANGLLYSSCGNLSFCLLGGAVFGFALIGLGMLDRNTKRSEQSEPVRVDKNLPSNFSNQALDDESKPESIGSEGREKGEVGESKNGLIFSKGIFANSSIQSPNGSEVCQIQQGDKKWVGIIMRGSYKNLFKEPIILSFDIIEEEKKSLLENSNVFVINGKQPSFIVITQNRITLRNGWFGLSPVIDSIWEYDPEVIQIDVSGQQFYVAKFVEKQQQ